MRDGLAAKNIFLKTAEHRKATCRSVSVRGRAGSLVQLNGRTVTVMRCEDSRGMRRQSCEGKVVRVIRRRRSSSLLPKRRLFWARFAVVSTHVLTVGLLPVPGSRMRRRKCRRTSVSVVSKVLEPHHKRDPSARKVTPSISRHSSAGTD